MSDKSRFRRGDFEARQRQLPADKHVRQAKGRAMQRARVDQENTPLGAPPRPVDVRSVYDTRPVNAFDFNIAASAATDSTTRSPTVFFQVPEGFVCVLRNFDVWLEPFESGPITAGIGRSSFRWSLQLNGGDYPYNLDVPFGIAINRETCFMIANEFNTVGLRVTTTTITGFEIGYVFARFYGNFLLKSGLPAPLEIGNLVPTSAQRPPIARPAPPLPPITPPPPAPVDTRARRPWAAPPPVPTRIIKAGRFRDGT